MLEALAHVHAVATLFMTGVIWFVQVVHYPLFRRVGADGYREYQREHERRTTWIVGPAMAIEVVTALALTALAWTRLPRFPLAAGLALLVVIHLSTAFLQVPRHRILHDGFDVLVHRFLTRSNWIRTVAWSLRAILAGIVLRQVVAGG